jgi:hypothetical protein
VSAGKEAILRAFSIEFYRTAPGRQPIKGLALVQVRCSDLAAAKVKADEMMSTVRFDARPSGYRIIENGRAVLRRSWRN